MEAGRYEDSRNYRSQSGSGERSDEGAAGMMKDEARLRSCFVGARHQALAGVACDWLLNNHMLGVAIPSPSDISRQDLSRSTPISLRKIHGTRLAVCVFTLDLMNRNRNHTRPPLQ